MQCGQGKPFTVTSTNSKMGSAAIRSYEKGGVVKKPDSDLKNTVGPLGRSPLGGNVDTGGPLGRSYLKMPNNSPDNKPKMSTMPNNSPDDDKPKMYKLKK
jgi:hypothetical protein